MSSTEFHDPRTDLAYEPEAGMVFKDARHGDGDERLVLIYIDEEIAVTRSTEKNPRTTGHHHRIEPRETFERQVGAGRLKRVDETPSVNGGNLSAIARRAEELESKEGRKAQHYAEALREALTLLKDEGREDDNDEIPFEEISGVGAKTAQALRNANYVTKGDIRNADNEDLLDLRGVGEANLSNIREYVEP